MEGFGFYTLNATESRALMESRGMGDESRVMLRERGAEEVGGGGLGSELGVDNKTSSSCSMNLK